MSQDTHAAAAHGADLDHHDGAPHGTREGYIRGFVLSVILTAIPFALVMGHLISSPQWTALLVLGIGVVQIVVHMIYFLHMNSRAEHGWTMLALIFTVVIVFITLSGSMWVMFHLNENMMPPTMEMNRQ